MLKKQKKQTPKGEAAFAALVAAIRAMPRDCFIELDDMDGSVTMFRRMTPGWAVEVGIAKVGEKRISL